VKLAKKSVVIKNEVNPSLKKSKSIIKSGITIAIIFICGAVNASYVTVTDSAWMTYPGLDGGGTSTHITGSFGGNPQVGPPHGLDEYSVDQYNWQYKCTYSFGWNCSWVQRLYDYTLYELNSSYLTNFDTYINIPLTLYTANVGTWGTAWYWSYNEGTEYSSFPDWDGDSC